MTRAIAALAFFVACCLSPLYAAAQTEGSAVPPPVSSGGPVPVANDARVAGDEERTRFILDLSADVEIGAFTLGDPYRVVIDLPEVAFELPTDAGLTGRGLVTGWRYGLFARGRSRIVLDTTMPVKIDKAFVLAAVEAQPARLVVDLVRTTPAEFQAELQKTAMTREASNTVDAGKGDLLGMAPSQRRAKPLVMLDPGHGGLDAGATAQSGVLEKDIVLKFAFELKQRLEATGKVDVVMTREDDRFIPLRERVRMARDQAVDLFVSVHADSTREDFVRGTTVYTLSEKASDTAAAALAAKENAADSIAGLESKEDTDEVSDILMDLTRRETRTFSSAFANNLVTELSNTTRMIKNPHRSAGFWVLKAPDVPSVLVEIGYLSNAEDEKLLTSDDWRTKVSEAVGNAVMRFFGPKFAAANP
ncbi:N-acetylmuramoyl-L-alanine amidase [Chthonobacter albigriseus]|uniref:N-acetylmuramoyl-L-alanine amidase n=1 Tax=Chthonobacter albigriseus TaxID=1683161 RepID=UPI0015EFDB1F|nr:N-acetylmuramoyl-L-alanine amidase [Chthonobacter albigriseus]